MCITTCSQYLKLYSYRLLRLGCCLAVTKLRLYWHKLLRSWWRLAVTSWGSGLGDIFQSLAEAQVQVTSCSHYLRLCLYRLLKLRWRFSVTSWGYAFIGCSGSGDNLQSLSETMLCIGYSGLGDVFQSRLRLSHVLFKLLLVRHSGIAEWLLLYIIFSRLLGGKTGDTSI